MIKQIIHQSVKENIATNILYSLPEWFGMPESTAAYIKESKSMPFFSAFVQGNPTGFIALKETSKATAEIYVMGVLKEYHRKGIGKQLCLEIERYARENGYKFLQVKTVKMGCYEEYDRTNQFYMSMGFEEFECIPNLWDSWNPCQIYVKSLQ